jgi:hypothetical protein
VNLEDDLRAALRPEPAPPDFAAKILRRARPAPVWSRPVTWAIAAAVAAAAVVPSAYQYHQHQRAIVARDQLIIALSITKAQLETTKDRIRQPRRNTQ